MRKGWASAYAVLIALVVTGCAHSSAAPADDLLLRPQAQPSGPPTPLTAVLAPLALTPAEEVARVGLRSLEIPSAQRVWWPAFGRSTTAPSLDFCAEPSAADRHRVAGRTVEATVPHSHVRYADRTVVYDSAASARPALDAVRRAAGSCAVDRPRWVMTTLPVAPSYALAFAVARPHGTTHVVLVAQQRGDVLDLLTLTSPRPLTPRQQRLLLREAVETGTRLARLPLASAGA